MGRSVRNWFLFSGLSLIPLMSVAQDELRPMVQQNDCDQQTAPAENEPVVPAVDLEKRQKAIAGLAAVGAIAILGVSVIAATMMWAKRLRRLARAQGPAQKTVGNDFWFLKPPKPIASDKEIPGSHRPPLGEKRDETS